MNVYINNEVERATYLGITHRVEGYNVTNLWNEILSNGVVCDSTVTDIEVRFPINTVIDSIALLECNFSAARLILSFMGEVVREDILNSAGVLPSGRYSSLLW